MGWCARHMLLATAVLSCSLMGLSSGCVAEPGSSSSHNKPAVRSKLPAVASGLKGRTTVVVVGGVGGGGGGSSLSLLGAVGSRERRLFETATALRGGSLAEKIPVLDAAASALAAMSVPVTAIAWTGGPTLFAQGVLLSMLMSIDGFRIREHFVNYGYGFSVALQAAGAAWLFRDGLNSLSALHAAGLVAYGVRLVLFCRWRDSLSCFQNHKNYGEIVLDLNKFFAVWSGWSRAPAKKNSGRPYKFWGIVSTLYALLALPTVYALRRLPASEGLVGVSQAGLVVMAVGLLVESVADLQKSQFKKKTPDSFCSSGLYRLSRHPNYFGEMMFWGGVWLAATPAFKTWYHWVFAFLGPSMMTSILLLATGMLEKKQREKYGSSKEWKEYAASTPVLVPGSRQYTWGKADQK